VYLIPHLLSAANLQLCEDRIQQKLLDVGSSQILPVEQIQQPREPEPSTINEKTIADFTRVVEQTGILLWRL